MDKETLSNYGWITIVTLVLAVMLALATPFGSFVGNGVVSISRGFKDANDKKLSSGNIQNTENQWDTKFDLGMDTENTGMYFADIKEAVDAINSDNVTGSASAENNAVLLAKSKSSGEYIVRLVGNVAQTEIVEFQKNCGIDLNGHTVVLTGTSLFKIGENIKVTVTDSKQGEGIHQSVDGTFSSDDFGTFTLSSKSQLIMQNVKMSVFSADKMFMCSIGVPADAENSIVKISNCKFKATDNGNMITPKEYNKGVKSGEHTACIWCVSDTNKIEIQDSSFQCEGVLPRALCFSGEVVLKNVAATNHNTTELKPHVFSQVLYLLDGNLTAENCTFNYNAQYHIKPVSVYFASKATGKLTNCNAICTLDCKVFPDSDYNNDNDYICKGNHFAYAYQIANTSEAELIGCSGKVVASNTQVSAIRVQNTGILTATNCDFSSKVTSVAFPNQNREYTVFANGNGTSKMTIKNSKISGYYGLYYSSNCTFTESGNTYNVTKGSVRNNG